MTNWQALAEKWSEALDLQILETVRKVCAEDHLTAPSDFNRPKLLKLLDEMLRTAQTIRIQQSQATLSDTANVAWDKFNAANKEATEMVEAIMPGEPEAGCSALRAIAEIAHAGGLDDLTEGEALNRIRRLSLPWWDKDKTNRRQNNMLSVSGEQKGTNDQR
jgi:hypothetical protein